MSFSRRSTPLLALGVALAGCAVNPRQDFNQVQAVVESRTGERVQWAIGTAEDQQVHESIEQLLQHELTPDAAAQIALLNNRHLQATFEDLGIAQADLVQAGLLKNPVFSFEMRFPGKALEVDVFQEIMDLLVLPLRKRVAASEFLATQMRVQDAALTIWCDTRAAWYQYQTDQQLVDLRRSIVDATGASADAARRLHDAGNLSDLDFANDRALHEQAMLDLAQAEADALGSRERVNRLMGLAGADAQRWAVGTRLPDMPAQDAVADDAENVAIRQRLDLAAAQQQIETLAKRAGMAQTKALVPELNIGVHDERDPDGSNTIGPAISLPLPIFDQGQPAIARAQAEIRQAQQRYLALAADVQSEVRDARQHLAAARRRAETYQHVLLPLRTQIVQQTQRQYNGMLVGIFQLLQAKQAEIETGAAYVNALRDYWVARVQLERAVGGTLAIPALSTQPAAPVTTPSATESPEHMHGDQP